MFSLNRKLPPKPRPLVVPSFLYFGYRVYHAVIFSSHWTVILRYSVAIAIRVFLPPDLFFSGSAHLERCSLSCFSFGYIFPLLFSIFIFFSFQNKKVNPHVSACRQLRCSVLHCDPPSPQTLLRFLNFKIRTFGR